MNTFLSKIIAHKREVLKLQKEAISLEHFKQNLTDRTPISLLSSLQQSANGIIAEFKRSSPSQGNINRSANLLKTIKLYEKSGASALSILTEERFFKGSLSDIKNIRDKTTLPILRKDFIIDEYQVYQAKQIGADAILLIASALSLSQCIQLSQVAHHLSLEVLLEIHEENELEYLKCQPDIVGINNRNLHSFEVSIDISMQLIKQIPTDYFTISESGIDNKETIRTLKESGFDGFLIGSALMQSSKPHSLLGQFTSPIIQ